MWICAPCGVKHGRYRAGVSTWHPDTCDWCGEETNVTEDRDYGYPPLPKKEEKT